MKLISKFFKKTRTLRFSIITFFLSLTIVAFAAVISFTYSKDYKQILLSSKQIAEELNALILEKFSNIALGSERITEITAGQFFDLGNISIENTELKSIMLNVIKYDTNFSNFYIGLKDGSFLGVLNLKNSAQTTYVGDRTKPLPPEVVYALRYVKVAPPTSDDWYYLNDKFETVVSEKLVSLDYDARKRPWYEGVMNAKGTYWTGFYQFYPSKERGITVASPVFDRSGEIVAVVGADLTYAQMENFLNGLVIGKTGKAFIISTNRKVVIPDISTPTNNSQITTSLVSDILKWYEANPQKPDFVFESKGVDYLAYVSKITAIFGRDLRIVIIAPLKDFFSQMLKMQRTVIIMIIGILILSSFIIAYFAQKIAAPIVILANEVNKIRQLDLDSEVRVKSNIKEIFLIDSSIAAMRHALRSFARYVPKDVVKILFQKGEDITLGGEKKELTIFFSDIAGFTTIAEALSIDVLTPLLTEYFDFMTKIILESAGTVDKFIGDGIMAFWGAPLDLPDHASRACTTALHCNAAMIKFNQKRKAEGSPEFRTRFGINTGVVIVGNIGTPDRMNYTVIGDAVNVTARLQEVDKFYHTSIIVSEDTHKIVKDEFVLRPLDIVNVKGKKEKIKIYELVAKVRGEEDIAATKEQIELCSAFTEAYDTYVRKDHQKARSLFQAILQKFPEDFPTQLYLKRIEEDLSPKMS